jgi:hypothetical protein
LKSTKREFALRNCSPVLSAMIDLRVNWLVLIRKIIATSVEKRRVLFVVYVMTLFQ